MIYPRYIGISSIDGVGKETTAKKVLELAKEDFDGEKAKMISFPRYETDEGKVITNYLEGKYGDPTLMNPYLASSLYAADRFRYFTEMRENDRGNTRFLIMDRGYYDNFIHQASKLSSIEEIAQWMKINYKIEVRSMPLVHGCMWEIYYLVLNEEDRQKQIANRSHKDLHESNTEYISKCNEFVKFSQTPLFRNSIIEAFKKMGYYSMNTYYPEIEYYIDRLRFVEVRHGNTPEEINEYTTKVARAIYMNAIAYQNMNPSGGDYGYYHPSKWIHPFKE